MMVAVHALTGAVLGRLCRRRSQALLAGAVSHILADAVPHRDLDIPTEGALMVAALGAVGLLKGVDSLEFAGAVGAVLPDAENLVGRVCGIPDEKLLMPTHRRWHGREVESVLPQVAIAAACVALLAFLPERVPEEAR